jgi:hypothetical protein
MAAVFATAAAILSLDSAYNASSKVDLSPYTRASSDIASRFSIS